MNAETESAEPKKRPPVSLPFLIVVGVLGISAYLAGPWVMKMVMLQQEKAKVSGGAVANDRPQGRPDLPSDGGAGGGSGDRGSFDPESMFAERDSNGDGNLEGDEISERMQERMESIDSNSDGIVSKEEFLKAMEEFRQRLRQNGQGNDASETEGSSNTESGKPESDSSRSET